MAFPTLIPSGRRFKNGNFPITRHRMMSGTKQTMLYANAAFNAELRLVYANITPADAAKFMAHYDEQNGTHSSFKFPSAWAQQVWGGWDKQSGDETALATKGQWRYAAPPRISQPKYGVATVEIGLKQVPGTSGSGSTGCTKSQAVPRAQTPRSGKYNGFDYPITTPAGSVSTPDGQERTIRIWTSSFSIQYGGDGEGLPGCCYTNDDGEYLCNQDKEMLITQTSENMESFADVVSVSWKLTPTSVRNIPCPNEGQTEGFDLIDPKPYQVEWTFTNADGVTLTRNVGRANIGTYYSYLGSSSTGWYDQQALWISRIEIDGIGEIDPPDTVPAYPGFDGSPGGGGGGDGGGGDGDGDGGIPPYVPPGECPPIPPPIYPEVPPGGDIIDPGTPPGGFNPSPTPTPEPSPSPGPGDPDRPPICTDWQGNETACPIEPLIIPPAPPNEEGRTPVKQWRVRAWLDEGPGGPSFTCDDGEKGGGQIYNPYEGGEYGAYVSAIARGVAIRIRGEVQTQYLECGTSGIVYPPNKTYLIMIDRWDCSTSEWILDAASNRVIRISPSGPGVVDTDARSKIKYWTITEHRGKPRYKYTPVKFQIDDEYQTGETICANPNPRALTTRSSGSGPAPGNYPKYNPSTRRIKYGDWNVKTGKPGLSGQTATLKLPSTAVKQDVLLELTYSNRDDAVARDLMDHYFASTGEWNDFKIPPDSLTEGVMAGWKGSKNYFTNGYWAYNRPPEVVSVHPGTSSTKITLLFVGPEAVAGVGPGKTPTTPDCAPPIPLAPGGTPPLQFPESDPGGPSGITPTPSPGPGQPGKPPYVHNPQDGPALPGPYYWNAPPNEDGTCDGSSITIEYSTYIDFSPKYWCYNDEYHSGINEIRKIDTQRAILPLPSGSPARSITGLKITMETAREQLVCEGDASCVTENFNVYRINVVWTLCDGREYTTGLASARTFIDCFSENYYNQEPVLYFAEIVKIERGDGTLIQLSDPEGY